MDVPNHVLEQYIEIVREEFSYEVEMLKLLQELKLRRESDLRPATKFLSSTVNVQMNHIYSELAEADNELYLYKKHGNKDCLVEELVDLQMSVETMLAILGLDKQQRMEARHKVIEKNRLRGYYEDGVENEC